jgi:hypothetical protein
MNCEVNECLIRQKDWKIDWKTGNGNDLLKECLVVGQCRAGGDKPAKYTYQNSHFILLNIPNFTH